MWRAGKLLPRRSRLLPASQAPTLDRHQQTLVFNLYHNLDLPRTIAQHTHAAGQPKAVVDKAVVPRSAPLPVSLVCMGSHHGTGRPPPTDSLATARSNVATEMFRAITRTVLFDHTAALSSMSRADDTNCAVARLAARVPFTVTSSVEVTAGARPADPRTSRPRTTAARLRQQRRVLQHRKCKTRQQTPEFISRQGSVAAA